MIDEAKPTPPTAVALGYEASVPTAPAPPPPLAGYGEDCVVVIPPRKPCPSKPPPLTTILPKLV